MTEIELIGELSVNNAEDIHKLFLSALEKKSDININVSELEDIDVSIMQLLYGLYIGLGDKRNITLTGNVKPLIKNRLYICGLLPSIDLPDDELLNALMTNMRGSR